MLSVTMPVMASLTGVPLPMASRQPNGSWATSVSTAAATWAFCLAFAAAACSAAGPVPVDGYHAFGRPFQERHRPGRVDVRGDQQRPAGVGVQQQGLGGVEVAGDVGQLQRRPARRRLELGAVGVGVEPEGLGEVGPVEDLRGQLGGLERLLARGDRELLPERDRGRAEQLVHPLVARQGVELLQEVPAAAGVVDGGEGILGEGAQHGRQLRDVRGAAEGRVGQRAQGPGHRGLGPVRPGLHADVGQPGDRGQRVGAGDVRRTR